MMDVQLESINSGNNLQEGFINHDGPCRKLHTSSLLEDETRSRSWLLRPSAWYATRTELLRAIGHTKAHHRMDRCWLKGVEGDALHAVLCAAGFNIRWLMHAIAAQAGTAAKAFFFGLLWLVSLL